MSSYTPPTSRAPRTTVFCAVWHGDPQRRERLAGHAACLNAQTRPVERIYVFDGDDRAPDDLPGLVLSSRAELTIYQAWNLAISQVRTPFLMNLNLDDRLAPDAVAVLEDALDAGTDLVGGDWKICYSQPETDAVVPSFPAEGWPFVPDWPPAPGTPTRLGSGLGPRGTFGPACLWRTELHLAFPRFPYQFGDGSLIRVIGDSVWWQLLRYANKKMSRVPRIIGNYHSHPREQAEFRYPGEEEEQKLQQVGIRW